MKRMRVHVLLLSLIFITACQGQENTQPPKVQPGESNPSTTEKPQTNVSESDPYFVETAEMSSPYGPRSITRNILQDRNGNMWFASWQGIVCYDGHHFINFTLAARLRHFHVFSLFEDSTGNLWFGTIGAGVYRYDGKTWTNFTEQDGLANNWVESIAEDKNGHIWFGTDSGVSRYDGKTFTDFAKQDERSPYSIHAIVEDKNGVLWFGTTDGLSRYDGKTWTPFMNQKGQPFHNVRALMEDKSGNIWIGSADGACRYDGKTFTTLTTKFTGCMGQNKAGQLWFGVGETYGMVVYRSDGKSFTPFVRKDAADNYYGQPFAEIIAKNNSNAHQIFCIVEDKSGHVWFGTDGGISRYDGKTFTNFTE